MTNGMLPNRSMIKMTDLANAVREKGILSLGEAVQVMDMAPATIYLYARAMRDVFDDIIFKKGYFYYIKPDDTK